jgi:hypothetical protein
MAIRIDDLGAPILTEAQRRAIAAAPPVALTVAAVLDAARAATGLADFGPADSGNGPFTDRLALWLESFAADADLGPLGRATVFGECVRYASTRLRVEDLYRRHPEITGVTIDRPIIIAGLPRSGTTNLVNLIATDSRLRSMPLWEAMEPIPAAGEPATHDADDPRFIRTAGFWGQFEALLPLMPAMHEMAPNHVHEDIDLQGPDFSSYLPEWLSRPHAWRAHYLAHDQTPHYGYAKRLLKAMTWLHGPDSWVMKSPPHMENLPALIDTYPDATVVITHRDPLAVVQSAITMIAYGDRIRRTRIDLAELADYWLDRVEHLLRACVRDRERLPAAQSRDIVFGTYMADQTAAVAQVYALAGLPMTAATHAGIAAYLDAARHKHVPVAYDLAGDFGVDIAAQRRRFAFYTDHFHVPVEVTE